MEDLLVMPKPSEGPANKRLTRMPESSFLKKQGSDLSALMIRS